MAQKAIPGRSSSQVSIYNYPEHLNPFYQDEQHKRLRFWKIVSNKKSDGKRRNSFSISLRELIPSFTLRKRSSTLGINKTSESPPPLRKTYDTYEDTKYNTFDPNMRHTVNIGLNDSFQRNTFHRSSVQDMNRTFPNNDLSFQRNYYRSTIQNGTSYQSPERRHFGQSMTSTPIRNERRLAPGSSETSINSFNPFEDDDGNLTDSSTMRSTTGRRRKKRRAPLPPTLTNGSQVSSETINENQNGLIITEQTKNSEDISRLAEEIQSFVQVSKTSRVSPDSVKTKTKNRAPQIPQSQVKVEVVQADVTPNQHMESEVVLRENQVVNEKDKDREVKEVETIVTIHSNKESKYSPELRHNKVILVNNNYQEHIKETQSAIENLKEEKVVVERQLRNTKEEETRKPINIEVKELRQETEQTRKQVIRDTSKEEMNNMRDLVEENKRKDIKKSPEKIIIFNKTEAIEREMKTTKPVARKRTEVDQNGINNYNYNMDYKEYSPDDERQRNYDLDPSKFEILEIKEDNIIVEKQYPELKILEDSSTSSREITPDYIPRIINDKFHVLRIDESNLEPVVEEEKRVERPKIRNINETPVNSEVEQLLESQGFKKVEDPPIALKIEENEEFIRHKEKPQENKEEEPKAPERRLSVKEIIESINRSQSLLRVHHTPTPQFERSQRSYSSLRVTNQERERRSPSSDGSLDRNMRELSDSERKIKELISEMEKYDEKNWKSNSPERNDYSNNNMSPRDSYESADKNNNLQKYNPVPKPRRSRIFDNSSNSNSTDNN